MHFQGGILMIILASKSTRRAKLLKDAGIDFKIVPSHIGETFSETLDPGEQAVDEEDAYRMLKLIFGKSHVVYTGVDTGLAVQVMLEKLDVIRE
jgi:predicted house-cleaning NTP pyrophosphatase (Maf/HAM1 superfamily)